MKRVIKSGLRKLNAYRLKYSWEYDFATLSRKRTEKVNLLPEWECSQLFLVPHADDELLAGYALTCLQHENIVFAYYGLTGSDPTINTKRIRDREFGEYTEIVRGRSVKIDDENDLKGVINEQDIRIVYLPSIIDWHSEHRQMNYNLLSALEDLPNKNIRVIWYSVTVPIESGNKYVVPMTEDVQRKKYDIFEKVYLSQSYMPLQRFQLQERLNSAGSGFYSAECYLELPFEKWKRIVVMLREQEPDKGMIRGFETLKYKIHSISKIRRKSELYYRILMGEKK